jgi:iron complex outermembrane recepter protein
MSSTNPTLTAVFVSLAAAKHAAPAFSQEASKKSGEEMETVVVNSLEAKRESQTVGDVLAAEDVGKFPHENVAEASQRVSGVSISREFGEGERVSIFNYQCSRKTLMTRRVASYLSAYIRQDSVFPS